MSADPARLDELATGVLGPIVFGGPMRLCKPFGPALGLTIGQGRSVPDDDLRSRIDLVRVRTVRLLAPVDVLPPVSGAEWAIAAAFNDLLQVTNHLLSGPLTRGRHAKLLASTLRLVEAIPVPRNTLEVLTRHALFSSALRVARTDTTVTNRVVTASFRGQTPPKRFYYWKNLRRISDVKRDVPVAGMIEGIGSINPAFYTGALAAWLACSPLSDLASVTRDEPHFHWSPRTLALVAYPVGQTLARRAVARLPLQSVVHALTRANDRVPPGTRARAITDAFAELVRTSA